VLENGNLPKEKFILVGRGVFHDLRLQLEQVRPTNLEKLLSIAEVLLDILLRESSLTKNQGLDSSQTHPLYIFVV
jgi:hypothetical protein